LWESEQQRRITDFGIQVDLKFVNRYHHSWPQAMRLLSHGVLDLKPLVTHRFPLEKADEALRASADRSSGSIKIHVEDGDAQEMANGSAVKRDSRM
jgi:threonine dehydrogenase-like Zn-dependent dehydrogenase